MGSPETLRGLGERVEALTGPDRGVDAEVHFAVLDGVGTGFFGHAPAYTASLDAAMTLVPEGCGWLAGLGQMRPSEPIGGAAIYRSVSDHTVVAEGEGATVALALCAAALRARARSDVVSEEKCRVCGGPAWVEHTGSVMPGIGIPCDHADDEPDTNDGEDNANKGRVAMGHEWLKQPAAAVADQGARS